MKKLLLLVMAFAIGGWAIPKPMESIENYNVLMVHGAYGSDQNYHKTVFEHVLDSIVDDAANVKLSTSPMLSASHNMNKNPVPPEQLENLAAASKRLDEGYDLPSAYDADKYLGDANLGSYSSNNRITKWLSNRVFEEPDIGDARNPRNSYIYNWRSFSNPANSSYNNARELGDRVWNKGNIAYGMGGFGHRRALMEEAQEVKAFEVVDELGKVKNGQEALEIIRKNPDLYHQLASRYILIGHSMGGVVSREYVQGNFYNGDVDKIITIFFGRTGDEIYG